MVPPSPDSAALPLGPAAADARPDDRTAPGPADEPPVDPAAIERLVARLDDDQRLAVLHPGPTLRILAGPGSGKTRVLTARIQRRVLDGSADPRHVLALTFTRRAAGEIRIRLQRSGIRDLAHVGTFHAIALQQLRQHRADNGRLGPDVVANRPAVLRELGRGHPELRAAITEIERAAARGSTVASTTRGRRDEVAAFAAELSARYAQHKRRRGLLDFDDILTECTSVLRDDERFARAQRWRFRHLFVDEFQDVNRTQFDLLRAWLGDRDDLCVVGDADQAIYGWNGADARFLTALTDWFPAATTVALGTNHRSVAPVVAAAQAVLGARDVQVRKPVGPPPTVSVHDDPETEAEELASRIRWRHGEGGRWSSHAVLARTNAQLDVVADAMRAAGVPHRIRGRGGIAARPEARAALDRLRAAGADFAVVVTDLALDGTLDPAVVPVVELAEEYLATTAEPSGAGFAQWTRTVRAADVDVDADAVDLVTFHAAKGLEWPHTSIVGFEEGLVPMNDGDEEQRLAYVALTRAELDIHLSWCRTRPEGALVAVRRPSRWLAAIETIAAPAVPATEHQIAHHLGRARDSAARVPSADRRRALDAWRRTAARARRVDPEAVLRSDHLELLATHDVGTVDEIASLTGLSPLRLRRDGSAMLEAISAPRR